MKFGYKILGVIFLILIVSFETFHFFYESRDNENWTGPYFSAAENLELGGNFNINVDEVLRYKNLTPTEQYFYTFSAHTNLTYYNHNPIGFAYIIKAATIVFPFWGNANALILFQVIIHIILCVLILYTNRTHAKFFWFFAIIYAANPIIINFVVLNYYYFWQCVPGIFLLYLIFSKQKSKAVLFLLTFALIFSTLSRPTIIFVSIFILILLYYYTERYVAIICTLISVSVFIFINKPIEKNIWHTVYVGIAAYPNAYVKNLSDDEGYALYKSKTGDELDASLGGNYYQQDVIDTYKEVTKDEVTRILYDSPFLFIKNATLNTCQVFSIGYLNDGDVYFNILSALIGLTFFLLLIKNRAFLFIIFILLYAGTFCLYYPPIQAYLYGAYVISAVAFYFLMCNYFPNLFSKPQIYLPKKITYLIGK